MSHLVCFHTVAGFSTTTSGRNTGCPGALNSAHGIFYYKDDYRLKCTWTFGDKNISSDVVLFVQILKFRKGSYRSNITLPDGKKSCSLRGFVIFVFLNFVCIFKIYYTCACESNSIMVCNLVGKTQGQPTLRIATRTGRLTEHTNI